MKGEAKKMQSEDRRNKEIIANYEIEIERLKKHKAYWKTMAATVGVVGTGTTAAAMLHAHKKKTRTKEKTNSSLI